VLEQDTLQSSSDHSLSPISIDILLIWIFLLLAKDPTPLLDIIVSFLIENSLKEVRESLNFKIFLLTSCSRQVFSFDDDEILFNLPESLSKIDVLETYLRRCSSSICLSADNR